MRDSKKKMIREARRQMEKADRYFASTGEEEYVRQYFSLSDSIDTIHVMTRED